MGLISTEKLAEGLVLASDVLDRSGRMLLASGVELTTRHIRMLMAWGIAEADIAGVDVPQQQPVASSKVDDALLQPMEEELKLIFSNVDLEHPAMAELFRLCLLRKVSGETRQAQP